MVLIKCLECNGKISSYASSCPHCGFPVKEKHSENTNSPGESHSSLERWCHIPEYEGYYSVSSFGRVRSEDREVPHSRHGTVSYKGKMLKPSFNSMRHGIVSLTRSGTGTSFAIKGLVALVFVENTHNYSKVIHIDGDKTNNRYDNLEWVEKITFSRQSSLGLNEAGPTAQLTPIEVREIRRLLDEGTLSQRAIAARYNVIPMTITSIKKGRSYKNIK